MWGAKWQAAALPAPGIFFLSVYVKTFHLSVSGIKLPCERPWVWCIWCTLEPFRLVSLCMLEFNCSSCCLILHYDSGGLCNMSIIANAVRKASFSLESSILCSNLLCVTSLLATLVNWEILIYTWCWLALLLKGIMCVAAHWLMCGSCHRGHITFYFPSYLEF